MRSDGRHVAVVTRAIAPLHGVGGLERHGRDLVHHLLGRGVRVTLITQPPFTREDADAMRHERLTCHFVPYRTFPGAGRRGTVVVDRSTAYPVFGWRAGRLAARLVAQGGIDLVHGMGAATLGYARARAAHWYETVPLLFNPHGLEEFGSTGPGLSVVKHAAYAPLRSAVRVCARAADRVIATDTVLVPTVIAHLGIPESRVAVVPNAVDVESIDRATHRDAGQAMRRRIGAAPEDVVLLSVGRLEANKGFDVLIRALASLKRPARSSSAVRGVWRLVLVGDGSERARLTRDVTSAGLDDATVLAGRVNEAELHAWYDAADLFVHPSRYEGSSIVTLEAMAHRRAVIATTAGGLRDKVRPAVNGWLVPPGDATALANALQDALAGREHLTRMGAASRAIVEQEFAWPAVMDRLLALYENMLTEVRAPGTAARA